MNAPTDPKLLINPLLETWNDPHGLPPFSETKAEHFAPAFDVALKAHRVELDNVNVGWHLLVFVDGTEHDGSG